MASEEPKTGKNSDNSSLENKQIARSFTRERFLRLISGLSGTECDIDMYEKTHVRAEFKGCDRDILQICVSNLKSPMGIIPHSIIRTQDILTLHISNVPLI